MKLSLHVEKWAQKDDKNPCGSQKMSGTTGKKTLK